MTAEGEEVVGMSGRCVFPLWPHGERPNGKFCNKLVRALGEPYCEKHHKVCYQVGLARLTAPAANWSTRRTGGLRAGVEE